MIEGSEAKSQHLLITQLLDGRTCYFYVHSAIMIYFEEYKEVLTAQVVFVVPPLFVFLVEIEFFLRDDCTNKGDFIFPASSSRQ